MLIGQWTSGRNVEAGSLGGVISSCAGAFYFSIWHRRLCYGSLLGPRWDLSRIVAPNEVLFLLTMFAEDVGSF